MDLTPNLTRKIQEINNNKLPRYYLKYYNLNIII